MKILFIRHGDPNYKDNCLTPLGHLQAEALAERLAADGKKYDRIYTSNYGRAVETAEHTAQKLGMPVTVLDFMHEISSGLPEMTKEEKREYSPWVAAEQLVRQGYVLAQYDFDGFKYWNEGRFRESHLRVTSGFDGWMKELGYEREGLCYRCTAKNDETLLVFAHGGSISCLIAHFLGVNPFVATQYIRINCTAINEIWFKGEEGELVIPEIRSVNDHSHMENVVYEEPQE